MFTCHIQVKRVECEKGGGIWESRGGISRGKNKGMGRSMTYHSINGVLLIPDDCHRNVCILSCDSNEADIQR